MLNGLSFVVLVVAEVWGGDCLSTFTEAEGINSSLRGLGGAGISGLTEPSLIGAGGIGTSHVSFGFGTDSEGPGSGVDGYDNADTNKTMMIHTIMTVPARVNLDGRNFCRISSTVSNGGEIV